MSVLAIKSVQEVLAESAAVPPFLVEGLVSATATVLYGQPKAGKGWLSISLAHALATGEREWLGHRIHGSARRVLVACTDPGGASETATRYAALGGSGDLLIADLRPNGDPDYWSRLACQIAGEGIGVLIVDNLLGAMPPGGEVNNQAHVASVTHGLRNITDQGIAVVLIHHQAKVGVDGGVSRTPMGSQQIRAWARSLLRLERPGDGTRRLLYVEGNNAQQQTLSLALDVVGGAGYFTVSGKHEDSRVPRNRTAERVAAENAEARFVLASTEARRLTGMPLGQWLAANSGESMACRTADAWRKRVERLEKRGFLAAGPDGWLPGWQLGATAG
ncbi:AAA family ATPase [Uniformispora flossi]|uniref:AAA family ATPase n=1 Tax=Uniformispora flossi TaxID=3390723 RepID=UPI003C2E22A3